MAIIDERAKQLAARALVGICGVAYYAGWKTATVDRVSPDTNWLYFCSTNSGSHLRLANLQSISTSNGGSGNIGNLRINAGANGGETSDFAVAEVLTWNRGLSSTESAPLA